MVDMDPQTRYLFYSPCVLAPVSILGSTLALVTLYRTPRNAKTGTYNRLMACMSVCDIIFSSALAMGPLPVPSSMGTPGARGTTATCTAQSVFLQLGVAFIPYSCMLMIYYVLVIRYNIRQETIARKIEPFMHALPIPLQATTVCVGLAWQVFNARPEKCWVARNPWWCGGPIECKRGSVEKAQFFGHWLLTYPMLGYTGVLVLALVVVAWTVYMRHRKSQRFVFDGSRGNPRAEKQARQVIVQCVLYAATFINMMFWATIQTLLRVTNVSEDITKNHIWVAYLTAFFFPLQGLFNFMIFIRPRYLSKREANTEKGRWFSLREAVWNPAGRRQSSSRGSSNTVNQSPQPRKQQIKLPDPVQCSSVFLAGQLPDESESAHPSEVDEERTTRSTSIKTARTSTASSMPPSLPLEPAICSSSKN